MSHHIGFYLSCTRRIFFLHTTSRVVRCKTAGWWMQVLPCRISHHNRFAYMSTRYSIEFDLGYGNHDVLLANIGILTASSFCLTVFHLRLSVAYLLFTICLGVLFLGNQIDELFSFLNLSAPEEISLVLLSLFTHLSHLLLSLVVFVKLIFRSTSILADNQALFVAAYWHLVEVVWILILFTIIAF